MILPFLVSIDSNGRSFARVINLFVDIHYSQSLEDYLVRCRNNDLGEHLPDSDSIGMTLSIYDSSQGMLREYFLSNKGIAELFYWIWTYYSDLFYNEVRDDFGWADWFPFLQR